MAKCRSSYLRDGIVTLPGFLLQSALDTTVLEVEKAKGESFFTDTKHNVFLDSGDSNLPEDHIRNKLLPTTVQCGKT